MEFETAQRLSHALRKNIGEVIKGQESVLDLIVMTIMARGHILLESVPGEGKTLAASALAASISDVSIGRISGQPTLKPNDLTGAEIPEEHGGKFRLVKGPLFNNIVLFDELNRTDPRTQSALLEAMQERQVTIGDETYALDRPFLVLATQNPIEQEGTYPLPEAQMDRFMFKLNISYPSRSEEREIMDRVDLLHETTVSPVVTKTEVMEAREVVNQIYVDDKAKNYIVDIVQATRNPEKFGMDIGHWIEYGASPRATIYLQQAARALAFMQGEGNVFPNDVKQVAMDILRHRVVCTYEAEAEEVTSEDVIRKILDSVPVP